MLLHSYGIDMGAGSVKIYDTRNERIISEMNMAAVRDEDDIIAIGDAAFEMYEKTPSNIRVVTPVSGGRISDVLIMEAVLHTLLRRSGSRVGVHPTLLFSVPLNMTEIERRAYYSIAHKGRLKRGRVIFLERPFADALALDSQLSSYRGRMIVNIGAETTEISVLSGDHVIFSVQHPIGGRSINAAIQDAVRSRHQLIISMRSAENLKRDHVELDDIRQDLRQVSGNDSESGLPRDGMISSFTVSVAVQSQICLLADEIRRALDRTPPQIRAIAQEEGIILAGGSSRIPGLETFLRQQLGFPVRTSEYHEMHTVTGLARALREDRLLRLAFGLSRR